MFAYIWPVGLVVLSNIMYHICAKQSPEGLNPFAALTITYLVGALLSLILFFVLNPGQSLLGEYKKINWSTVVLGLVIVGLEAGCIYAYKAGWEVSKENIVQSTALSILLLIVGAVLYKEEMTWNKLLGMAVCAGGLVLINLK